MANPNHIALLRAGSDAWNRHRAATGEAPDVNEADLSGVSLISADLRGGLMFRTNLRGANLSKANLSEAHVGEADLTDAILTGANFVKCFCVNSNFLGANLQDADLREATLHNSDGSGSLASTPRRQVRSVGSPNHGREAGRHANGRSQHDFCRSALLGFDRS